MINLKEKVNLIGKKVKIVCTDGQIVVGIFSEIFDKEDKERNYQQAKVFL